VTDEEEQLEEIRRLATVEDPRRKSRFSKPKPPTVKDLVGLARQPYPEVSDEDRAAYGHPPRKPPLQPRSVRLFPPPQTGGEFDVETYQEFKKRWADQRRDRSLTAAALARADPPLRPLNAHERHVFAQTRGVKLPARAVVSLTAGGSVVVEQHAEAAAVMNRLRSAGAARRRRTGRAAFRQRVSAVAGRRFAAERSERAVGALLAVAAGVLQREEFGRTLTPLERAVLTVGKSLNVPLEERAKILGAGHARQRQMAEALLKELRRVTAGVSSRTRLGGSMPALVAGGGPAASHAPTSAMDRVAAAWMKEARFGEAV
jgi:hypothetical protein